MNPTTRTSSPYYCYRRIPFLRSDQTCQWLADALEDSRQRLEFSLWAYVFMPEHVHLIVVPRCDNYDLAVILKAIKQPVGHKAVQYLSMYAPEWLAKITVQRGQRQERRFWQAGGGYDRNIVEPKTLFAMIEYIYANPIRRGLVERAEDWKWSSVDWREGKNTLQPDWVDMPPLQWLAIVRLATPAACYVLPHVVFCFVMPRSPRDTSR